MSPLQPASQALFLRTNKIVSRIDRHTAFENIWNFAQMQNGYTTKRVDIVSRVNYAFEQLRNIIFVYNWIGIRISYR